MTRTKLGFVCFVAARNCMRQQVAGRSSQRHATLPTYYKVVLRTEKVLLCTTKSTNPVLLCTTKYYSSTTLYYKVLLQYYSVLQSTTPVLLRTTKYYSGTPLYYSSTSLCYKVPSHMKRCLQCGEQQESASNFSKYCACHEKWISWLILVTHETLFTMRGVTSVIVQTHQKLRLPRKMRLILVTHETLFTMRGATSVIVQTHQILRLPRKMTLMINSLHTWNAIYNARSNKCHCPNSPNTAPATQNDPHDQSSSHMKRYLQCAE